MTLGLTLPLQAKITAFHLSFFHCVKIAKTPLPILQHSSLTHMEVRNAEKFSEKLPPLEASFTFVPDSSESDHGLGHSGKASLSSIKPPYLHCLLFAHGLSFISRKR